MQGAQEKPVTLVSRMLGELDATAARASLGAHPPRPAELDADERTLLRDLGYAVDPP